MAHFAELNDYNEVIRVIAVCNSNILDENNIEQEIMGIKFCQELFGGNWIQTSYNNNFRKNYASIGYLYDKEKDAFIPPKPFNSWILNEVTCNWEAPIPMPDNENLYYWNEISFQWESVFNIL